MKCLLKEVKSVRTTQCDRAAKLQMFQKMFHKVRMWMDARADSAREKKRWDTRGLTANNDHTCGVEGLSGPYRVGVPQTRRTDSFPAKDSGEQKIHEKRTKSFHEARRKRTHEYSQQAETRETCAAQRR